jgi:hypothetical protein
LTSDSARLFLDFEPTDATEAEIAKELSNPVAALVSVPLQNNFDFGGGPKGDGFRYPLNVQPGAPFQLNENWNLISRTIFPFVHQDNFIGTTTQDGLSEIVQSYFLHPSIRMPARSSVSSGPVFLLRPQRTPASAPKNLGSDRPLSCSSNRAVGRMEPW